jgi:hypothetical protein
VQRAFEIAPDCASVDEIRSRLKKEGYESVQEHLQGNAIQKELRARLKKVVQHASTDVAS